MCISHLTRHVDGKGKGGHGRPITPIRSPVYRLQGRGLENSRPDACLSLATGLLHVVATGMMFSAPSIGILPSLFLPYPHPILSLSEITIHTGFESRERIASSGPDKDGTNATTARRDLLLLSPHSIRIWRLFVYSGERFTLEQVQDASRVPPSTFVCPSEGCLCLWLESYPPVLAYMPPFTNFTPYHRRALMLRASAQQESGYVHNTGWREIIHGVGMIDHLAALRSLSFYRLVRLDFALDVISVVRRDRRTRQDSWMGFHTSVGMVACRMKACRCLCVVQGSSMPCLPLLLCSMHALEVSFFQKTSGLRWCG